MQAQGGRVLETDEHFLESEKSGNWNSFVTGKNDYVNFELTDDALDQMN